MSWKRQLLASTLRFSGVLRGLSLLRKNRHQELTILAYHRIGGPVGVDDYPYDHDLVSATVKGFEWQMKYLKKNFNPVTFRQVKASLEGSVRLPPRAVIVSFDDGFDDNYRFAFPVLKQLGVPATFFVSTGYLGKPETFWFDRVVYLMKNTSQRRLVIDLEGAPTELDADMSGRYRQAIDLVVALRAVADTKRLELLASVNRQLGSALPASDELSRPMSWEMVIEMAAAGMEIGSHTVSHPNLVQLTSERLVQELTESRQVVEKHTGQQPVVIAYPVGNRLNFNENVIEVTREAGYSLAASYISGVNAFASLDKFALNRLHVESYTGDSEFAATLEFPGLFG